MGSPEIRRRMDQSGSLQQIIIVSAISHILQKHIDPSRIISPAGLFFFFARPSVLISSQGYLIEDGKKESSERSKAMRHKLQVSVSKEPKTGGIAAVRKVSVRERLLRLLLGETRRVIVLIPGDRVDEIAISEEVKDDG